MSVRRRPYVALVNAHDSNTSNTREALATPAKGRRIRLLKARVIQVNTDQGSQFTSQEFTQVQQDQEVKISMDGKGRYADNIFVERLWRTVK